tara:strand:+ start:69 stop:947 length:879 start_codon:yes stop_codon:yes gene_type:complete
MRTNHHVILIVLGLILFSCSTPETNADPIADINENHITEHTELSKEEKRKKAEEENKLDSLRLVKVLNQTLDRVKSKSFTSSFSDSFQTFPDSIYKVDVKINFDFLFSNKQRHLTIHRYSPGLVQIDVFSNDDGALNKILSHEQWSMEYMNDTLQDINGDGLNDLVVNCYGVSGCCLKAFSNVYLIHNNLQSFSIMHDFLNPTFSSKEGVIRGVCYGHPGETELYKLKWNGDKIDTVEYVSFERDKNGNRTGKVIISNQYPHHKNYKIIRTMNSVPKEYKSIEGFDWFAGEI